MKLFTGWMVSAGLVLTATAANAQALAPYEIEGPVYSVVSDFQGSYAAMPPENLPIRGRPMLLPAPEVYTVVRESGFSPLGIPQQRGFVYTIAVIDRGGDDGRLVIDARTGRILRFMPASRMGDNFDGDLTVAYGPVGPLPPVNAVRGLPRPPAPVPPKMASRIPSVPMPKAPPRAAIEQRPLADKSVSDKPVSDKPVSEPAQQSASLQAKPREAPAPQVATGPAEAKSTESQILPTQEMPNMQGLE